MASDRIEVAIVLDDGSIQKGFVNLEKLAETSAARMGKSFKDSVEDNGVNIDELRSKMIGFGADSVSSILKIGAALAAVKLAFDGAFAGEKIAALNKQFETLASSQGIVANDLRQRLEGVAAGLADDEALINSANQAIITLGKSANRLPEILELSRRAAFILGVDFQKTFDSMVNAIENGNAKALKNFNIIIDTEKVYKDYAKTLGTTAGELTQVQKQQALLNAVLDQGAKSLKNVDAELTPIANSFQRLKTKIADMADDAVLNFNRAFGPSIAKSIDFINEKLLGTAPKTVQDNIDATAKKIESFKAKIDELNAALTRRQEASGVIDSAKAFLETGGGLNSFIQQQINANKSGLIEAQTLLSKLTEAKKKEADEAEKATNRSIGAESKLTAEQIAQINIRKTQVEQALLSARERQLANNEQLLQFETDFQTKRTLTKAIFDQKLQQLEQDTALKILEVNKNFSNQLGFNEAQREALRTSILQEAESKRILISAQANEAVTQAAQKQKERLQAITSATTGIIKGGATALGEALSSAGNAFENFGKGIAVVIADQVINLGQALIVQGLAIETFVTAINSLLPGSGAAAAAAGLGLVLFGTALKAAVGGGSSKGGASTDTGGGVSAGTDGNAASPVNDIVDAKPKEPDTKIELNIQGDVLDSEATGLRIVDLLNTAFDKQGVVVTGMA